MTPERISRCPDMAISGGPGCSTEPSPCSTGPSPVVLRDNPELFINLQRYKNGWFLTTKREQIFGAELRDYGLMKMRSKLSLTLQRHEIGFPKTPAVLEHPWVICLLRYGLPNQGLGRFSAVLGDFYLQNVLYSISLLSARCVHAL